MGRHRRQKESKPLEVAACLIDQLEGHCRLRGHELHLRKCIQAGHVATFHLVKREFRLITMC